VELRANYGRGRKHKLSMNEQHQRDSDSSKKKFSWTEAIVICTKERPRELKFLLDYLESQISWSALVLVVDSSPRINPEFILDIEKYKFNLEILQSRPSLPYQRNLALDHLSRFYPQMLFVHFIDDDVIPSLGYFEGNSDLLSRSGLALAGSRDLLLVPSRTSLILQLFGLKGKSGQISAAGLSTPPDLGSKENMWTPGQAFSTLLSSVLNFRFDEEIAFFGEDIEATLRFRTIGGAVVVGSRASLLHVPANRAGPMGLYDAKEVELRHRLAAKFPAYVSKKALKVALLLELLFLTLSFLVGRSTWDRLIVRLEYLSK
jgi:hypothetical protein